MTKPAYPEHLRRMDQSIPSGYTPYSLENTGRIQPNEEARGVFSGGSMLLLLFAGLAMFLGWAAFFEIDHTVRAQGQVIPQSRTQIIQVADGGVLASLQVQEGQEIKAGQILAVLEKERVNASVDESRAKMMSLQASLVRAQAEISGKTPVFSELFRDFPKFAAAQMSLYHQRLKGLRDDLSYLQSNLIMAKDELRTNETLYATGDISRLDVMRSQREVTSLEGKISEARNKYLQEAHIEMTRIEAELASARSKLDERLDVLGHTELVAPVAGVVKYLRVSTLGGVLRAGDELMQISPTESDMIIEVRINPSDIGQLTIGLPVSIKLDAFDYSIYGALHGELIYLSSDTLTENMGDGKSMSYYRGQIRVDKEKKRSNPKLANVELRPGMTAGVDIRIGSRTILSYLAKPLVRAFSGALTQGQ